MYEERYPLFPENDQDILSNYLEISDSIYKGSDRRNLIFVEMRGDYEILKIVANKRLSNDFSLKQYNDCLKAAINDAMHQIKSDRLRVLTTVFNFDNGEI